MDQEQYTTEYDGLVQTRELQMLKSLLPFANVKTQMPLAILIQTMEFRNTVQMFQSNANVLSACSVHNEPDKRNAMLQTLRRFCTPKEKETIDTLLNIMCMMENYDTFSS
jgi:hypothetical protein